MNIAALKKANASYLKSCIFEEEPEEGKEPPKFEWSFDGLQETGQEYPQICV
jgi:hypothetical protein